MKNTNTIVKWLAAFVALVVVLGCGGGGGGTGGGTGTTGSTTGGFGGGTPAAGQYLEFFRSGVRVDPLNLSVGNVIVAQYVNYDQFGTRTQLAASNWTLSGTGSGSAITISSQGVIQINSIPSNFINVSGTAQVVGQPKTLSQDLNVAPSTGTHVKGKILANVSSAPVAGIQVEFVDNGGNVVGAALTDNSGNFNGTVANTAAFLRLKAASVPVAYFAAIKYQGVDYAVTGTACLLSLPTLVPGGTVTFPSSIFLPRQQDGPPPPPTGCN